MREGLWEGAQSSTVQSAVQSIATGIANLKRHKTTETVLMNTLKRQKFTPEEQEQAMQLMRDKNFDFGDEKQWQFGKDPTKVQSAVQSIATRMSSRLKSLEQEAMEMDRARYLEDDDDWLSSMSNAFEERREAARNDALRLGVQVPP